MTFANVNVNREQLTLLSQLLLKAFPGCVIHQSCDPVRTITHLSTQKVDAVFVDSDDWIEQEMYATMLDCGQEAMPDVVICGMLIETSKGIFPRKEIVKAGFYDKDRMQKDLYPIMLFDFAHCTPAVTPSLCNKLFKKQLLGNIIEQVNDTIAYGEDALCTYSGLLDADRLYITSRNMYHYRNHSESVCNTYSCSLMEKFSLLITQLQSQFQQRDQSMIHQLYGYAARHALECIRSELLYNNGISYWKKRSVIADFLSAPFMWESISYAISKVRYLKTKVKLFLCQKRYIEALYIGYCIRRSPTAAGAVLNGRSAELRRPVRTCSILS